MGPRLLAVSADRAARLAVPARDAHSRGRDHLPGRLPRVDVLSGVGSPTAALTTIDECSRLVRAIVDAERWLLAEQRAQRAQAAGDVLEVPTTGPAEILTPGDRP